MSQLKILERELGKFFGAKPRRRTYGMRFPKAIAIFADGTALPFRWDSNIKRYLCGDQYQNSTVKGLKEDILAFEPETRFENRK